MLTLFVRHLSSSVKTQAVRIDVTRPNEMKKYMLMHTLINRLIFFSSWLSSASFVFPLSILLILLP